MIGFLNFLLDFNNPLAESYWLIRFGKENVFLTDF